MINGLLVSTIVLERKQYFIQIFLDFLASILDTSLYTNKNEKFF